jgi:hypothetical protein
MLWRIIGTFSRDQSLIRFQASNQVAATTDISRLVCTHNYPTQNPQTKVLMYDRFGHLSIGRLRNMSRLNQIKGEGEVTVLTMATSKRSPYGQRFQ